MNIKTFAILLLVCLSTSFGFPHHVTHAKIVDKIVALVGDTVITRSDLNEEIKLVKKHISSKTTEQQLQQKVLDRMIQQKIMDEELAQKKISITDSEVENTLTSIIQQKGLSRNDFEREQARKGIPVAKLKEQIRTELKQRRFMEKVIYPKIRVTDYDLIDFFEKHTKEYQSYEKIRFLEILLTPDSMPSGTHPMVFAKKLVKQLKNGTSFSRLAKKYSRGAFANKGGNSGLILTSMLRPELLNILLSLKKNITSEPIPLPNNGILILKVVEARNPKPRSFAEVKEMLSPRYFEEKAREELEQYLMNARSRHFVEIRI